MMNVVIKRIVEIAGGIVIGSLMSEGVDKAIEVTKKAVDSHRKSKGAQ